MRFPHREVHSLTAAQENFAFLESGHLFWGNGAPVFVPTPQGASSINTSAFYFRLDTPTVANQRLYVWSGSAWTGIL